MIQELYREGLVSQTTAALMGPKQPDEDKAIRVVQARQAVEALPRPEGGNGEIRGYRRAVDRAIRETLGRKTRTPLEQAQWQYLRLSPADQERFLVWVNQQGAGS